MKLATSAQMRELDAYAIHTLGIPSDQLMTRAAGHVARAAMGFTGSNKTAAVFCGSGNNGGDGIAAAASLKRHGHRVRVFLTGSRKKMTPDALEMERRFMKIGGTVEEFSSSDETVGAYLAECGVIIDAMFGIGLHSELRENARLAVSLINAANVPVVAADIPSGIEADTGARLGDAVRADVTVTFTLPKPGHFIGAGAFCTGTLEITDIGIPAQLSDALQTDTHAVFPPEVFLPHRKRDSHKGDYGRLLLLCGSTGYTGAASLAAQAAVRGGAGLVHLGVPAAIYEITAVKNMEAMPFPLPCDERGRLTEAALPRILDKLAGCNACLVGPGLGRSPALTGLVTALVRRSEIPMILDADGINAVGGNIDILDEAACPLILTPHEGEFRRLGGNTAEAGRLAAARSFATGHGCTLVLKGPGTLSALPGGTVYVNTTGNPGMAKGGSGDVLAGLLAAFLGQGLPPERAAYTAVFVHGMAGDLCARRFGEYGMTPSDMIAALPEVLMKIVR